MDTNVECRTLCQDVNLSKEQSATLSKRIQNNYYVHLYEKHGYLLVVARK
jgi:hypothetical protein